MQIERDDIGSILFWGPPGVGKTTLAKIIARRTQADFVEYSAVMAGIKEIKQVMVEAERARQYGRRTIVFIDEFTALTGRSRMRFCRTWSGATYG